MPNIKTVSKLAGVSVATVSRALQKPELVSEKTREKVIKAVKEVGYTPNMMARNFRIRKSYAIMVLVPDIANPFFSKVIRGIQKAAKTHGYNIILGISMNDPALERELANLLHSNQADGILQLSARFPLEPHEIRTTDRLPIVNCCECVEDDSMPTVALDNAGATRAMTDHLVTLGHRHIGLLTGPRTSPLTAARLKGHQAALRESGLDFNPRWIMEGDYTMKSGRQAIQEFLACKPRPTAILCFNDEMAIGAMQGLKQAGLSVPEDISVTGFDNLDVSAYTDPPLTTISQSSEEFGARAMELLFDMMTDQKKDIPHLTLPFELITRNSTAPISSTQKQ